LPLPLAFLLTSASALLIAVPTLWETLWPLTWVALLPLFLALRDVPPGRAFLLGWWTETLAIWIGFHWLIGTMVRFGFIPLPMSLLFLAIMGIGNGVRLGLLAAWLRFAARYNTAGWYRLVLPACAYVTIDYLFPRVFPWYLGFTQFLVKPLIQIADLTGVHGITFLIVLTTATLSLFFPHPTQPPQPERRRLAVIVAMLLLLNLGYGAWRMPRINRAMQQAAPLRITMVQPNIGIYEKSDRDSRRQRLQMQIDMSRQTLAEQPDLIIWPESTYPYMVPAGAQQLAWPAIPEAHRAHWLIGALTYRRSGRQPEVFNSALLIAPDGQIVGRYDKQVLLAFGEYIPLRRYLPFLRNISPAIGNLTPGSGSIVTLPNGVSIGPLICYEDILPTLARRAVRRGAQLLVNMTNDAWFGDTRAPYQHRMLAAFRAIEHRVYLVRVTNTGLTSTIDPLGREQGALPLYQRQTHVQQVQPLRLATIYTRFGDWFAQLCSAIALLLPLCGWRLKRKRGGNR
jgi:apolipoprotein N-acyltransferase